MTRAKAFFFYITSNPHKTMLYIGVTNNLSRRLKEHFENRGLKATFAGKHYCYELIYWESFFSVQDAIEREKTVKKWSRRKKENLINDFNPYWACYNHWIQTNQG
jgi:putative endonuclease